MFEGIGDHILNGGAELSLIQLATYLGRTDILGRMIDLGGVIATRTSTGLDTGSDSDDEEEESSMPRKPDNMYEGILIILL